MRQHLPALLLLLVAALSSGCGGSSGEPPTAPATQVEFEVFDLTTQQPFAASLSYPAVYHFVAEH
jgi:hypothetical protein